MIDWQTVVTGPCIGVFGEPVLYSPAAGAEIQISGVFDDAYKEVDILDGMGIPTESPVLGINLADLSMAPKQGDQMTILRTGEIFTVKKVRADGHGAALLFLNSASYP